MTDEEQAREIAGKLTRHQRHAITSEVVRDGEALVIRYIRMPATRCWLQRNGLLVNRMYSQELTPLGLAVRTILEQGR